MIDQKFKAVIGENIGKEGWTCVAWRDSVKALGTGKTVKVVGAVDGQPIQAALMPTGLGTHMLSLNKEFLKKINKGMGDEVEVYIKDRVT